MRSTKKSAIWILIFCMATLGNAAPMGTGFTYQGRLIDSNDVANGIYDFGFALFDDPVPGVGIQQGYIDVNDLDVIDGYFTVELDFGSEVFNGDARWLEIEVRPGASNDPNAFVKLIPRHEVTPTPYALYAKSAGLEAPIQVSGSFDFPAAVIEATNTSTGNGYAIAGVQADKGTVGYVGGYYGIYGRHDGNLNYGYLGGSDYGVYGRNINENYGYLGSNSYGVYGSSLSGTAGYFTSSSGYGLIVESGNVGIGTTSPDALLEVAGASSNLGLTSTSGLSPFITFDHLGSLGSGSTIGSLNFKWGVPNPVAGILAKTGSNTVTQDSAHLTFRTASAGISLERMRIDENGNVGIGTLSPSKDLEVISKSIGGGIKVYGDASTGSHDSPGFHLGGKDVGGNNRTGDLSLALSDGHFSSNAAKGDLVLRAEDTNIHFSTQSSGGFPAKMTIKSDGKVGIGTANPPTVLALGTGVNPIISVASTIDNDFTFLGLAGGGSMAYDRGSSIALHGNEHTNKGTMWFRVGWDPGTMTGANDGDLIIETAHTERFRIDKDGNIGIGTNSPTQKLDVSGTVYAESDSYYGVYGKTSSVDAGVRGENTTKGNFGSLGTNISGVSGFSSSGMGVYGLSSSGTGVKGESTTGSAVWAESSGGTAIKGWSNVGYAGYFEGKSYFSGNVGIGTASPASRLHVAGGCITGSMCSDIRLKKNIEPLPSDDSVLDRVMGLHAVTFEWKHRDDGKRQIGLIAQDVEEVFPEVVTTPDDDSCEKGLLATGMDAVLVEAIKELKAENELLRQRLEILERMIRQKSLSDTM